MSAQDVVRSRSWPASALLAGGLVLTWLGERVAEAGNSRLALSALGVAALLGALAWRTVRSRKADAQARPVEQALSGLVAIAVAAVGLYYVQSDVMAKLDFQALSVRWPTLASALAALWPAVLATAAFPLFFMELAYGAMARAPRLETARLRDALFSGLGLASALIFAFSAMYVASERDAKVDLSYFRTAKPGEATQRLVQSLTEPVVVYLFFPPANDVAEQVRAYFDDLKGQGKLQVQEVDHALEPQRARELGVSANGAIVLQRGGRKETVFIGQELEKSRAQLRTLDQDVQKKLLQVARSSKTIYLTTGHGERSEEQLPGEQRSTIALLRGELKAQNYELRTLSASEGLGSELPKDAAAVLVLGPRESFSPPEAAALEAYAKRGGKLLIAVDPEAGKDFAELLAPLGLTFGTAVLANDTAYAKKTYTPQDRTIIGTRSFSSHPAVTSNSRGGYPMFAMGAGAIEEAKSHPAELVIDFPVRAEPNTWNDLNSNYQYDAPAETRKAWGLAAAVTRKAPSNKPEEELRALVLGDSDAVADEVLQGARGNAYFVLDGLKWLLGDEALAGATNTETDAPILRTRQQDMVWFYATIFLGPAVVVLAGVLMRRKGRRGAPVKGKEAAR